MKNIFLCGFMGCGKTTVGKSLASILKMKFIDMDVFIEENAGERISDIFKKHGEIFFRTLETEAAKKLSKMSGCVVATGGGAVMSPENTALFKSGGYIVLIDVPLEIIALRLSGDDTRPLLKRQDKEDVMSALYHKRMPVYRAAADFTVENNDNRPGASIASNIAEIISDNL